MNILALIAIPVLILINGLFVAVEFALVAIRRTRVEELVRSGTRGARAVESAIRNLDRTIAAAQLGITLASIALGAIGEPVLVYLIEPWFDFMPAQWQYVTKHSVAVVLALLFITMLHVILGEQVPKMAALQATDTTVLWLARPLNWFAIASLPLLKLMNGMGNWTLRRMGLKPGGAEQALHSVEELRLIIDDTEEAGLLESDQAIFLKNVFMLTDKEVRDCMIPKEKMDAIEISTPADKILEIVRECGHTRMPVYRETLDNIVGILNTKNLFYFFTLQHAVVLEDALYPATYLDPEETIGNAMRLFRKSRRPMALVRNSEGHILGLLTLEDVLEEIVGDIEDEHDVPASSIDNG